MVKNLTAADACVFEDTGFEASVRTNIRILALTVWHSEMKDVLVLLCCSGLMVNNTFIFITVRVCVSVYMSLTSFSASYHGHLKFCASF